MCQSNFVYFQQTIICEKHLPYYVYTPLEVNEMYM